MYEITDTSLGLFESRLHIMIQYHICHLQNGQ